MYRTKSHQFYKPKDYDQIHSNHEGVRKFWKIYRKIKMIIKTLYDISSVLVIIMSFDKVYKYKSFKVIKTWQVAQLIERFPRMLNNFRNNFMPSFH
jgi:hypothetical protein